MVILKRHFIMMETVHMAQSNSGSYNRSVDPYLNCLYQYSVSSSYFTLCNLLLV